MNEPTENIQIPSVSNLLDMFMSMPTQAHIGIALSFVIWFVGGNIMYIFSLKRRGIPLKNIFRPSIKMMFGYNKIEWIILVMIAVASVESFKWGISAIS